ncbi:MAG: hypothetical protein R3B07_01745 [Polyangiaceae bacterium]
MYKTQSRSVLHAERRFVPSSAPRTTAAPEFLIEPGTGWAILQLPTQCDGTIQVSSEVEITERTQPTVPGYIVSSVLIAIGLSATTADGPSVVNTAPAAGGGLLLTGMLLASQSKRSVRREERALPERDYPCGAQPQPNTSVRIGLGPSATTLSTDAEGRVKLPRPVLTSDDPPAVFVDGRAVVVRFREKTIRNLDSTP